MCSSFKIHIVGTLGPGVHYLFVYWACGPSRGLRVVRWGKSLTKKIVLVNEEVDFGHNGPRGLSEDECLLG